MRSVTTAQVRTLLNTDDPETFKLLPVQTAIDLPKKRRRRGEFDIYQCGNQFWLIKFPNVNANYNVVIVHRKLLKYIRIIV